MRLNLPSRLMGATYLLVQSNDELRSAKAIFIFERSSPQHEFIINCVKKLAYKHTMHTHTHTHTLHTVYWLTAVFLGVCLVDGLIFNKYTFSYIVVLLLLLFIVTKSAPEFDNRDKESIFHGSLRWLYRFVIYWLSGVILEVCLVWLLLTVKYTFIHIIVVLLLLSLVFSFIWIIVKIPIDWFYNRDIKNPFRYMYKTTGISPLQKLLS